MKPLHRSTWRTESDCGVLVDVAEGRTTEWVPFREIVVTTDAGMTPAEARRLIVDLQHAVAVAEEFDAPEREDVSTEDQPKPREPYVSRCVVCGKPGKEHLTGRWCLSDQLVDHDVSEVLADSEQVTR